MSYDLGGAGAAAPAVDVARVKTAVENTFTAFQQPPTVMLAPIGKSSLASRRKKSLQLGAPMKE